MNINIGKNIKLNVATATASSSASMMQNIFNVSLVAAIVGLIIYFIYTKLVAPRLKKRPTTANILAIQKEQLAKLKDIYTKTDRRVMVSSAPVGSAPVAKEGFIDTPTTVLGLRENFIINYHYIGYKNAGYLGPSIAGVFDEASAMKLGVAAGARVFIMNIEDYDGVPLLIARDGAGTKRSLNEGNFMKAMNGLMGSAFAEVIEGRANPLRDAPCILYLRLPKIPSKACAKAMAKVLNTVKSQILTTNEHGDFTHHRSESRLFLQRPSDVARKLIIVCNQDTSGFDESSKTSTTMTPDLDYFIHARVWKFGELESDISQRSAYEMNYSDMRNLNEDGIKSVQKNARLKFFIGYDDKEPTEADIEVAHKLGIQTTSGFVLENDSLSGAKAGMQIKANGLRYVLPEVIKIAAAPKEMDSNQGILTAPKI